MGSELERLDALERRVAVLKAEKAMEPIAPSPTVAELQAEVERLRHVYEYACESFEAQVKRLGDMEQAHSARLAEMNRLAGRNAELLRQNARVTADKVQLEETVKRLKGELAAKAPAPETPDRTGQFVVAPGGAVYQITAAADENSRHPCVTVVGRGVGQPSRGIRECEIGGVFLLVPPRPDRDDLTGECRPWKVGEFWYSADGEPRGPATTDSPCADPYGGRRWIRKAPQAEPVVEGWMEMAASEYHHGDYGPSARAMAKVIARHYAEAKKGEKA